jgi:hypothetical protein
MFGKKNSTKILAAIAIFSNAGSLYFMHKKAPIVKKKLDELPKDAKPMDKIKVAAPIYWPVALMFCVSTGSIVAGCAIGEAELAAATSLAAANEAMLAAYQKKAIEELGIEKANDVQAKAAESLMQRREVDCEYIEATSHGADIFFDPLCNRLFTSSKTFIDKCVAEINTKIVGGFEMFQSVNDFYRQLDLKPSILGSYAGWNIDKKLSVDTSIPSKTKDGRLCWLINYVNAPVTYKGDSPIDSISYY